MLTTHLASFAARTLAREINALVREHGFMRSTDCTEEDDGRFPLQQGAREMSEVGFRLEAELLLAYSPVRWIKRLARLVRNANIWSWRRSHDGINRESLHRPSTKLTVDGIRP